MSPTLIAFLFSVGVATWFYSKMSRRSGGGNSTPAIIGSIVVAAVLFPISYYVFHAILK